MEKENAWQDGPIIINSPDTVEATNYYNSLKKFAPPGVTNFTWDDASGQMRDGHIFTCIMWSDAALMWKIPQFPVWRGKSDHPAAGRKSGAHRAGCWRELPGIAVFEAS